MRLDPAVAVDIEEELRRAEKLWAVQRDESAVAHRLALDQRPEGGERVTVPAGADRHGEVGLIAVALPEMLVQAVEAGP